MTAFKALTIALNELLRVGKEATGEIKREHTPTTDCKATFGSEAEKEERKSWAEFYRGWKAARRNRPDTGKTFLWHEGYKHYMNTEIPK